MATGETLVIKSKNDFIGPPAVGKDHVFWFQDPDIKLDVSLFKARLGTDKTTPIVKQSNKHAPVWLGLSENSLITANGNYVVYVDEAGYQSFLNGATVAADQIGRDLWIVSVSGGKPVRVTSNRGDQAFPALGHDRRVVWFDGTHGHTDLMTREVP
jgi:bacillolysin